MSNEQHAIDAIDRLAWQLHHIDGLPWHVVADELEESVAHTQRRAAAYAHITDIAAEENQEALF